MSISKLEQENRPEPEEKEEIIYKIIEGEKKCYKKEENNKKDKKSKKEKH